MKKLSEAEAKAQIVSHFLDCGLAPDDVPDAAEANESMKADLGPWRKRLVATHGFHKAMKIIAYVMGSMSRTAMAAFKVTEPTEF